MHTVCLQLNTNILYTLYVFMCMLGQEEKWPFICLSQPQHNYLDSYFIMTICPSIFYPLFRPDIVCILS